MAQWRAIALRVESLILAWAASREPTQDADAPPDWLLAEIARIVGEPRDWRALFGRIATDIDFDVSLGLERIFGPGARDPVRAALIAVHSRSATVGTVEAFAARNAALITNVSELMRTQVATLFEQGAAGLHTEALAERIQARFAIGESRARLWARDQTLKLHGQITQERHRAAGITRYIWTASGDERVRPIHEELDGTVQLWSDPPAISEDGRVGHPGDDYQCRCTAYPVLDDPEV